MRVFVVWGMWEMETWWQELLRALGALHTHPPPPPITEICLKKKLPETIRQNNSRINKEKNAGLHWAASLFSKREFSDRNDQKTKFAQCRGPICAAFQRVQSQGTPTPKSRCDNCDEKGHNCFKILKDSNCQEFHCFPFKISWTSRCNDFSESLHFGQNLNHQCQTLPENSPT